MKFKKSMIALALLGGIGMVGCTSNDEGTTQNSQIKEEIVITDVQAGLTESGLLTQMSAEMPAKEHWVFDSVKDVIEDGFVSQAMINVKLQDVFFVKTSDMDAVEKAILTYKEQSLRNFEGGYGGEDNISAVANSKLVKKDGYVYFIATPNADEVEAKLLELIG